MNQLPEVMKTKFVSSANKLRQEGRPKGLKIGRQEELERKNWDTTKNMLHKGFETSIICEVLDVTNDFVEEVIKSMKN